MTRPSGDALEVRKDRDEGAELLRPAVVEVIAPRHIVVVGVDQLLRAVPAFVDDPDRGVTGQRPRQLRRQRREFGIEIADQLAVDGIFRPDRAAVLADPHHAVDVDVGVGVDQLARARAVGGDGEQRCPPVEVGELVEMVAGRIEAGELGPPLVGQRDGGDRLPLPAPLGADRPCHALADQAVRVGAAGTAQTDIAGLVARQHQIGGVRALDEGLCSRTNVDQRRTKALRPGRHQRSCRRGIAFCRLHQDVVGVVGQIVHDAAAEPLAARLLAEQLAVAAVDVDRDDALEVRRLRIVDRLEQAVERADQPRLGLEAARPRHDVERRPGEDRAALAGLQVGDGDGIAAGLVRAEVDDPVAVGRQGDLHRCRPRGEAGGEIAVARRGCDRGAAASTTAAANR